MRYLQFLGGPLAGTKLGIEGDVVRIGREVGLEVSLDDINVSRRHAELHLRSGKTFIRDLGSTNGTFVNGSIVLKETSVTGSDQIAIGDSLIVFLEYGVPATGERRPTGAVVFGDSIDDSHTDEIKVDAKSSRFLNPEQVSASPEAAARLAKLYGFISDISPLISPDRLVNDVLDRGFEIVGADRGFIMLLDDSSSLRPAAMRLREGLKHSGDIRISRRLTEKVLTAGTSVLSSDSLHDAQFKDSIAISAMRVSSFVCSPLKHRDKVLGLLYFDTLGMTKPLVSEDLELVSAIGLLAGTQLANARYYAEIQNAAEYNQSILRCLRSGIAVVDPSLRIKQVNEAACLMFHKPERDLIGRSLAEFAALAPLSKVMDETIRSGIPCERQEIIVEVNGEQLPLGLSTSLLRDHENRLMGAVANFRDLKVFKKLSEQVRMSQHLAVLGEMAAGIAHEIRNPLNSIRGFAQLLGELVRKFDENKVQVATEYVQIVVDEVDRMNRLVQDMLDFSRQRELTTTAMEIGPVVKETIKDLSPEIDSHRVEVTADIDESARAMANAGKLKQVMMNLIRNAIQAMTPPVAPEDRPRRLGVSVVRTGDAVRVVVSDTGMGMDAKTAERVFQPFFTTRDQGTGLGLAICQKIIQQHGGSIDMRSHLGVGTEVVLEIPAI